MQSFPAAGIGGGLGPYDRLTAAGYRVLHPDRDQAPGRMIVSEISPSRFQQAMATADVIMHTLVTCHAARVQILHYHGDGQAACPTGTGPVGTMKIRNFEDSSRGPAQDGFS